MSSSTIGDPAPLTPHECGTPDFEDVSPSSGFTPLELDTIYRILLRMAQRLQQENTYETLPEERPLSDTVQPVRAALNSTGRKSRNIRQTVHYQPSEK